MKILMVSSEAAPFAKTGGLADVAGALPGALAELGHETAVLLPRYRSVSLAGAERVWDWLPLWIGSRAFDCSLHRIARGAVPFYLLDCPALFDRDGIYGGPSGDFPDNHLRFAALARAAFEVTRRLFRPRILHCHDWQAGLVPAYLRGPLAGDPTFSGIRTLFTIHNLGYPGRFLGGVWNEIGGEPWQFGPDGAEFHGDVSYLQAGLTFADALSTVSPTYAREIQTPEQGFGLDPILRRRSNALTGIVNGVDYGEWNPESDPHLAAHYSAADPGGKRACKLDLIRRLGLDEAAASRPLIGIVSRFAPQKGLDLVAGIRSVFTGGRAGLAVLGSGETQYEEFFQQLAADCPGAVAVRIGYDNALAHQIEAGADIFLMPSRYEPCGLNQIYSLRYGTVPVVRATGGLDDTIEEGTGFKFHEYTGSALAAALDAALGAFPDSAGWALRIRRGMEKDFSWQASAREYSRLYNQLAAL